MSRTYTLINVALQRHREKTKCSLLVIFWHLVSTVSEYSRRLIVANIIIADMYNNFQV